MKDRILYALVTGANRGIGKEICRQLADRGVHVFLSARDEAKGLQAVKDLERAGQTIEFLQMDVRDPGSLRAASNVVQQQTGRLDIIINNAAILRKDDEKAISTPVEIVRDTFETNVIGALQVIQVFLPLLKKSQHGRIVNLSSEMGALEEMGGGYPGYRISKTGINALTRILSAELSGSGILVNSVCPGWVRTKMGGPNASRSVEKGAETAVWLALLPPGGQTGGFFRDKKKISW